MAYTTHVLHNKHSKLELHKNKITDLLSTYHKKRIVNTKANGIFIHHAT